MQEQFDSMAQFVKFLQAKVTALEQKQEEPHASAAHASPSPGAPAARSAPSADRDIKAARPETFSGAAKENAIMWLEQFKRYFRACKATPDVNMAVSYLRGNASLWWSQLERTDPAALDASWEQFCERLKDRFSPVQAADISRRKLLNASQTGSASAYVSWWETELQNVDGMDEKTKIDLFIKGLKPAIQERFIYEEPTTLVDAMNKAVKTENRLIITRTGKQYVVGRQWRDGNQQRSNFAAPDRHHHANTAPSAIGGAPVPMELALVEHRRDRPSSPHEGDSDTGRDSPEGVPERVNNINYDHFAQLTGKSKDKLMELKASGKCFRCSQSGHLSRNCPSKKF